MKKLTGGRLLSKSITGRWLLNGVAVLIVAAFIAIFAFSAAAYSYYYTTARTSLEEKAASASEFFRAYVSHTYAEYYQSAKKYTESFEDKDSLELQFVNSSGYVEASSYGLTAGAFPGTPDIDSALQTGQTSVWTGQNPSTSERIMAISCPLLYADGTVIGVMRYITSTTLIDRSILRTAAIAAGVGVLLAIVVVALNLFFIHSITIPIRDLTDVARRIAEGGYGAQAEKKYDDEIGTLTDAINEMSTKVALSEQMQTEFISSVSHELRTPLTAITGWSETLLYDENLSVDSRRGLHIIAAEAERLTKMVEELLEFTRIQDGRFNLNIELMDVSAELEDSMLAYGELLRKENIKLEYTPPENELPLIYGDPLRMRQVFLNVLDNASKYGRSGGRIAVTAGLDQSSVVITVRDFGPGIPANELPHVKKKFYKGSSKERGSGIGLAVCDEIMTRHGGSLDVVNAPDGGVAVVIKLPIKQ